MSILPRAYTDPEDIEARLASLGAGLTIEVLHNSLKAGHAARENTSRFHPRLHGSFNGYAETTAMLRGQLSAHGWTLSDDGNYARALGPDGRNAIVVATGDANTGIDGGPHPQTRSAKGVMTAGAVLVNAQLNFLEQMGVTNDAGSEGAYRTWILLAHEAGDVIRAELSSPSHFEGDKPEQYTERLILPVIDLDGPDLRGRDPHAGDDFDVDVTRRSA